MHLDKSLLTYLEQMHVYFRHLFSERIFYNIDFEIEKKQLSLKFT